MPRQGSRRKLAKYVYEDANGISAVVYVTGHKRVELRFPLKTPLADIRRAMERRARQFEAMPAPVPSSGTVAHVISQYVAHLGTTMSEQDERSRLQFWVAACGAEDFGALTRARLTGIREDWLRAGLAQNTVAKRMSSLRKVARTVADASQVDGPPHAIELIKRPRTPRSGVIRARPLALVERVLANLPDWNQNLGRPSKTKARIAVWAWTGQNPALLQQLRPEHVKWTTTPPQLYVQPRRKGAGVDAGWIPLLPQAVAALREFFARDAGGPWDKGVLLRGFQRALKKTQRDLRHERRHQDAAQLEGMVPRDLRHSIGTALLEASGDVFAVSEYLRHSDIKTTLLYTRGASSARTEAAVTALRGVLQKNPPSSPKDFSTKSPKSRGESRQTATKRHEAPKTLTSGTPAT